MFKNLLILRKHFIYLMEVKTLLLFAVFMGLGAFTLLFAVFGMFISWHWHPWTIIAVCGGLWLLLIAILGFLTFFYSLQVKARTEALLSFSEKGLPYQVFSLVLDYMTRKKS